MAASSSLTCSIRGCVNEFGITDSSHLLYVCTLDDIQCKSWLAVIPKTSLKPLHDKLCVCSLHFVGGSGAATDSLPTIFPPVPGSSEEMITDEPSIPGPAIKIKEEPVDDYEQSELSHSGMESSECTRSPAGVKEEDDESSMEVTQGPSVAGPSRRRGLIPASAIKKEVDDLTNGATSSSAADDDSSSLGGGGGFLRLESVSYPVKQEPMENGDDEEEDEDEDEEEEEEEEEEEGEEEDEDENSEDVDDVDESTVDGVVDDDAEIATPAPGSGCGVDPGPCVASSSSSAYLPPAVVKVEEFGECPAEDYEIENLGPSSSVTIKTEPPDEPTSADQGCQAEDGSATSVALMPPGFISEDAAPSSSVAVGSSMLTVGNGILAGDTGFVISNAFSCATGAGVAEDQVAARKHQATSTGRSTRTVWTQTYEPEKRTVWTQVAQLGDLKMLYHRSTQTDPWLERSPRLPKVTRRKRTYDEIAGKKH